MFQQNDIAEYYNTTQVHYENWWGLRKNLSLHYGIWDESTKNFNESLKNTNKTLLKLASISESDRVLDAGCGVGGAAFFINETTKAKVVGISLSNKQLSLANEQAKERGLKGKVEFYNMDFTNTNFESESFDVVWACESVCHAANKADFIKEAYRLLKKGGKLIMSDFFIVDENQIDKNRWIDKWKATWAVPDFVTASFFKDELENKGFSTATVYNYTSNIKRSARRMYFAGLLGGVSSWVYRQYNPKVSRFAKDHYKCGIYQYKALKENLWTYNVIMAEK